MNNETTLFLFALCAAVLLCVILYQHFAYRSGIRRNLREINKALKEILDADSDGRVMLFTENKELMELVAQVNCLLEKHQKAKADYLHSENTSKKMLSNISHDIKTPLTVILGYMEIMRLQGTNKEMLGKVEQKAQNLMELINEFFTLAKLEAGDMDIELSRIGINELCRESVLDFYGMLTENQFQVELDIPEDTIYVQGNRDALQRILNNLISNVIRYGADGKYLGVVLRTDEKSAYIDVIDKGKGIDKPFAESVFDRLFTMEDSRNRRVQGNGLGLTIARNLAQQLGGDITLESKPFVKTIFTIILKKFPYQPSNERNL